MVKPLPALATAIALADKISTIGDGLDHRGLQEVIGDLRSELATLEERVLELTEENDRLKRKLADQSAADDDPCPRCRKRAYHVESSEAHPVFGELGTLLRTYVCRSCQFSEQVTFDPAH
jgi:hypothetical protein